MSNDEQIPQWLRRRKIVRWTIRIFLLLILLSILLDHNGAFGYPGNDAARFDRQSAQITRAIDGDTICIKLPDDRDETTVHLLGVDAPDLPAAHWSQNAAKYTAARTKNRTVTLRLDPVGWRNDRGELLAYLFITDADNLNLDLIHDGQAYADRRTTHSLHAPFESAETEARKKKRGLWKDFTDNDMPAWRKEWLRSRSY